MTRTTPNQVIKAVSLDFARLFKGSKGAHENHYIDQVYRSDGAVLLQLLEFRTGCSRKGRTVIGAPDIRLNIRV